MMNVAMCGDSSVYHGLELVIYSMLTYNKNINFYILSMDVEVKETGYQIRVY
jgi:lipopolysaccharide biosynthesis glycosyltransferase